MQGRGIYSNDLRGRQGRQNKGGSNMNKSLLKTTFHFFLLQPGWEKVRAEIVMLCSELLLWRKKGPEPLPLTCFHASTTSLEIRLESHWNPPLLLHPLRSSWLESNGFFFRSSLQKVKGKENLGLKIILAPNKVWLIKNYHNSWIKDQSVTRSQLLSGQL